VSVSSIPIIRSNTPAIFWVTAPIFLLLFNIAPLAPKYQIKKITIKSGRDVPIPNTDGRTTPYEVINTIGINVNRNKTNIVGQNANVKLTPIKKLPKYLSLKTFVGKLKIRHAFFH